MAPNPGRINTFSKSELEVISQLGNGNRNITKIAQALKMSRSQIYRIAQSLNLKGILTLNKSTLEPELKTHINLLMNILSTAKNLCEPLSGTGLQIFLSLQEPKTIKEVETQTGLHKTTVLKKINQGRKMSLLEIKERTYKLNEKIWPHLVECIQEISKYEVSVDPRIPANSTIYFKTKDEIIFSIKEDVDATKTAFSAYADHGIKLLLITNYYHLPKRQLSKREIFLHSLYVAEKTGEIRELLFIALFLAKYRKELSKVKHQIVENLQNIFTGKKIDGYPTLIEIQDRAKVYNIEI